MRPSMGRRCGGDLRYGPMAYWVLASHPANFRVLDSVLEREEDWWRTGGRPLAAGDRVAIWKYKGSEGERGVIALGEVLTDPAVVELRDEDDPYWLGKGRPLPAVAPRVRVRYIRPGRLPLWYGDQSDSVVNELSVSRSQGGTAFRVSDEQWDRLLEEVGGWPGLTPPSVASALAAIVRVVRAHQPGQGFGLDSAQRLAVELRAMAVVEADYVSRGWAVKNVSESSPYDLLCRRDNDVRHVEVKGTTGSASVVLLTKNEVTAARADPSAAVLAVVHGIRLVDDPQGPRAVGGKLLSFEPWTIEEEALEALVFRYILPTT